MSHEGFTGGEYGAKTNLCEDDTFRVPISKKGMMKDPNPGYQTTMKGTQTVVGNNWEAILTFKVKKEPCSICC